MEMTEKRGGNPDCLLGTFRDIVARSPLTEREIESGDSKGHASI